MNARLAMRQVEKSFGATRALRGVSLDLAPGEVLALIGENGAGKSTLMKVLSGACRPDAGRIELDGAPFVPDSPLHARRSGIAMIYQELTLAPHLSIEENILLGDEPARWGWLDRRRRRDLAHRALEELHHPGLPLDTPAGACPLATQQIVEIARALVRQPRVLILDEPTSSLTQRDAETLFAVVRRLRERGVSVIYISHFLEECRAICDRYTVLRDGESVGSGTMAEADLNHIIRLMVGRDVRDIYPRIPHALGTPVLQVSRLAGRRKPASASFTLRAGEILGIAGLVGAGRTETLRAIFGLDDAPAGSVTVLDRNTTGLGPRHLLNAGVGLLSEDRKSEGLLLQRHLADNVTLTRLAPVSRFGLVSARRQQALTGEWMRRLDVRARGPAQPVGELSGGNQQKIAVARLLHHQARILLLDEPTRGIDVGSKAHIYRLIGELAAQGKAIVFVSSYLPELLGVCDTIGVMCRGRLREIRPVADWTEHDIMAAAIGQSAAEDPPSPDLS
ncbi:MAG: sugar ABC transporter ATP-binding protein [Verrucomicrobiae bacterium]|nr:sugar ABC transporter ATP-binding protein [Verrucomicrobiae bacterium]